jgi:hypothetical protein
MFGPNNNGGKAVVATLALAAACPALTLAAEDTPSAADVTAADEASASATTDGAAAELCIVLIGQHVRDRGHRAEAQ